MLLVTLLVLGSVGYWVAKSKSNDPTTQPSSAVQYDPRHISSRAWAREVALQSAHASLAVANQPAPKKLESLYEQKLPPVPPERPIPKQHVDYEAFTRYVLSTDGQDREFLRVQTW